MKTADLANEFALLREFLLRKTEPSEKHKGYRVCPLCSKNKLRLGIKDWQCLTGQCHEQHRGDLLGLVQASGWREELDTEASNGNVKPSGRPKATTSTNGTTKHTPKPFESFKAVVEWAKSKANQVIVYNYDDGHKVLRLEKAEGEKEFRPVHLGDGGWHINKGDNPWPLLITREPVEGDILVITEGEKAAQAITATRGRYVGVCSQGGSNGVKGTDWATLPQGFHVVVWPDADGPGEKYAKAVAERIPGALLVDVSGQPDKWDAADLVGARYINGQIELGMKATEADALVHKFIEGRARQAASPGMSAESMPEEPFEGIGEAANVDHILAAMKERRWLWGNKEQNVGWIIERGLHLVEGKEGTGKTRWLLDLCRRWSLDLHWPDGSKTEVEPDAKLLFVASDSHWDQIATTAVSFGIPSTNVIFTGSADDPYSHTSIDEPQTLAMIRHRLGQYKIAMVVVDTLMAASSRPLVDPQEVAKIAGPLRDIAREFGVPVVMVGHLNSQGETWGRSMGRTCDNVIRLEADEYDEQLITIKSVKARWNRFALPVIHGRQGESGWEYASAHAEDGNSRLKSASGRVSDAVVAYLRRYPGTEPTRKQLVEALVEKGHSDKTVYRVLKEMVADGVILEIENEASSGKRFTVYDLPPETV